MSRCEEQQDVRRVSPLIVLTLSRQLPPHPQPCPVLTSWVLTKARSLFSHSCWRRIRRNRLQNNLSISAVYQCTVNKGFSCLCGCQETIFRCDCEGNNNRGYGVALCLCCLWALFDSSATFSLSFPETSRKKTNVCVYVSPCVFLASSWSRASCRKTSSSWTPTWPCTATLPKTAPTWRWG